MTLPTETALMLVNQRPNCQCHDYTNCDWPLSRMMYAWLQVSFLSIIHRLSSVLSSSYYYSRRRIFCPTSLNVKCDNDFCAVFPSQIGTWAMRPSPHSSPFFSPAPTSTDLGRCCRRWRRWTSRVSGCVALFVIFSTDTYQLLVFLAQHRYAPFPSPPLTRMQISKYAHAPHHRWHPFEPTDNNNKNFSAFPMRLPKGAKFTRSAVVHLTRWNTTLPVSLSPAFS
jgi:hypothetical protein